MTMMMQALVVAVVAAACQAMVDPTNEVAVAKISEAAGSASFGQVVALSADAHTLVVSAPGEEVDGVSEAGVIYVFGRVDYATWEPEATIVARNPLPLRFFGYDLGLSGDGGTLIAGSRVVDRAAVASGGGPPEVARAEIWQRNATGWYHVFSHVPTAGFVAGQPASDTLSVAMADDGRTAVVGRPYDTYAADGSSFGRAGSVAVFQASDDGTWDLRTMVFTDLPRTNAKMGSTVAISADATTIVAGAAYYQSGSTFLWAGAYAFRSQDGLAWTQEGVLFDEEVSIATDFGVVAISGDTAVVASEANGRDARGSLHVWVRDTSGNWTLEQTFTADDAEAGDALGRVALSGDVLAAGAFLENGAAGAFNDTGSAYLFQRAEGFWTQEAQIYVDAPAPQTRFGTSIALSETHMAVGTSNQGVAFVFDTGSPSAMPTSPPSSAPSMRPSSGPSLTPTSPPSRHPSLAPSTEPSLGPSTIPSLAPSGGPSLAPSPLPSLPPSGAPSLSPMPSRQPSLRASGRPSAAPTATTLCAYGILNDRICCAAECGVCDDSGCMEVEATSLGGPERCCPGTIIDFGAPCAASADVACVVPGGNDVSTTGEAGDVDDGGNGDAAARIMGRLWPLPVALVLVAAAMAYAYKRGNCGLGRGA